MLQAEGKQSCNDQLMPKTKVKAKSEFRIEKDNRFLLEAPEVAIFVTCLGLVNELRGLERSFNGGRLAMSGFVEKANAVLTQLSAVVAATERFDIVMPVFEYGRFSPFFWRWFNWWDDHFKGLNRTQIEQIGRLARARRSDYDTHRPEDHWLRYRHTPAFTLVMS